VRYIQPVLTSRDDCSDFENQDLGGTMNYLDDVIMPSFGPRAIGSKCHFVGADVRSNRLEQPAAHQAVSRSSEVKCLLNHRRKGHRLKAVHSFLLRCELIVAFALTLPVQAWGQADSSKTKVARSFREGRLLHTFGKWEIRKGLVDNTYLLIGESTRDGEGHFWLHCDQNRLITVAVPLVERPGTDLLRSHAITVRADTGLKRTMSLIVFENFVAVAIDYEGGHNGKVAEFFDVLHAAKETLTISYAHRSFDYDVAQLPAAQTRFLELCNRANR
jgi:hypothetical protein